MNFEKLLSFGLTLFISSVVFSQEKILSDYIFPKGILKSTFNDLDTNGAELEECKTIYEYSFNNNIISTVETKYFKDETASMLLQYFLVTDTAIYLTNLKSEGILKASNYENNFANNNCYLKLPPKNGFAKWTYANGKDSKNICNAYFTKLVIDNVSYDVIKVEKIPLQNEKYLLKYKTYEYYVKGKGLYKLNFAGDKLTFFRLVSEEFEDNNSRVVPPPSEIIPPSDEDYDPIYYSVQIEPQFPGGTAYWVKYLQRNLNDSLPSRNGAPKGNYTVNVSFVVDKNGNTSDFKAENNPGFGTAEEAIRVIKKGPAWKPAIQNGHCVKYRQKQAITFVVH